MIEEDLTVVFRMQDNGHYQPSITRVSRQVRQETLGLWYREIVFFLELNFWTTSHYGDVGGWQYYQPGAVSTHIDLQKAHY